MCLPRPHPTSPSPLPSPSSPLPVLFQPLPPSLPPTTTTTIRSTVPEDSEEVLLSPEVTYGPPGLDLSCPVVLTVSHCADLSATAAAGANNTAGAAAAAADWAVRLKRRTADNKWEESTSCYCLLEARRCHLLLGGPGRYALLGRPLGPRAAKRLRLAVFGGPDAGNPLGYNLREVMSVDEESTSCYCLLEARRCHLLLAGPGRYALLGRPLGPRAAKRLRLAVFGGPDAGNPLGYNLRVYCVDDTAHALQCGGGGGGGGGGDGRRRRGVVEEEEEAEGEERGVVLAGLSTLPLWNPAAAPCLQAVAVLECVRGGRLLEEPKTLQFSGSGLSLQVSIQDVPQLLWSIKPFTTCQCNAPRPYLARQHLAWRKNLSYFACQRSPSAVILSLWEVQHQAAGDVDSLACALEEIDRAQSPGRPFTASSAGRGGGGGGVGGGGGGVGHHLDSEFT
ncbi:hypothetical protein CRUP_014682 [Coryphaenoides rupestris]|nr:hypothetical protein CRUP_014682 [Coryphaenoides rupestris]